MTENTEQEQEQHIERGAEQPSLQPSKTDRVKGFGYWLVRHGPVFLMLFAVVVLSLPIGVQDRLPGWWIAAVIVLGGGYIGALYVKSRADDMIPEEQRALIMEYVDEETGEMRGYEVHKDALQHFEIEGQAHRPPNTIRDVLVVTQFDEEEFRAKGHWRGSVSPVQIDAQAVEQDTQEAKVDAVLSYIQDLRNRVEPKAWQQSEASSKMLAFAEEIEQKILLQYETQLNNDVQMNDEQMTVTQMFRDEMPDHLQPSFMRYETDAETTAETVNQTVDEVDMEITEEDIEVVTDAAQAASRAVQEAQTDGGTEQ